MKYILIILLMPLLFNCKNDSDKKDQLPIYNNEIRDSIATNTVKPDSMQIETVNKSIALELKQEQLIKKKDERIELQKLVIDKRDAIEKDDYTINFHYPLLNESFKPTHTNFNNFMNQYYANISKAESEILQNKLLCDSIEAQKFREERFIDYKIYNVNDQLISLLFYKENYYSGSMHPSFTFDCFNFNLVEGVFMNYEDFFTQGSEEELLTILNEKISNSIKLGNLYYDCWEIEIEDFFRAKNNFVLNDNYVEFYFDDCVMCPSYTGTYSIELPLVELLSVLKKFDSNPLVF
ncbi:DUF3298 domain-containing protein [Winogradskyella echinorum]|uniref:DUF3298 domain-containing protein n=1 Tax=Winogradskyella echinorum TaxID=538189 RepID=A0ABR6Y1P5_9FLAO|nr:RsiV family protein [Winogradskyella echinorum]MBC3846666.1 DUF3298 domain-containing protein [Winogradskyella echinorum]MBC5751014.1 DUF3298 domain-containing protein [Winogradskyella echinorum]